MTENEMEAFERKFERMFEEGERFGRIYKGKPRHGSPEQIEWQAARSEAMRNALESIGWRTKPRQDQ